MEQRKFRSLLHPLFKCLKQSLLHIAGHQFFHLCLGHRIRMFKPPQYQRHHVGGEQVGVKIRVPLLLLIKQQKPGVLLIVRTPQNC